MLVRCWGEKELPQTVGLVPPAIFVDLLLSSLQKLVVDVLMAQGDVVGVISTAVELRLARLTRTLLRKM